MPNQSTMCKSVRPDVGDSPSTGPVDLRECVNFGPPESAAGRLVASWERADLPCVPTAENSGGSAIGRIGHYDLLEVLGRGATAIVMRAFDTRLRRPVAIKVLTSRYGMSALSRNAFLREARAAASVRHEHVVQTYSVEEFPLPIIVMEYVEGETLQNRLDRIRTMDSAQAAAIGRQIAIGIAAAHVTGLIHRDIKPANVLLEAGDVPWVKITDFGLAQTLGEAIESQDDCIVGTPMFMSPEQANGQDLDSRTDLFSLGSLLYTVVTGRCPFAGSGTLGVLKRVIEDSPAPILELNPGVHPGLCSVIGRLMAKSPADRYETAMDAADALGSYESAVPHPAPTETARNAWPVRLAAAALLSAISLGLFSYGRAGASANYESNAVPVVDEATAWENSVAALPAPEQFAAVLARLRLRNPEFSADRHRVRYEKDAVAFLYLQSSTIEDLSPLHALRQLRELEIFPVFDKTGVVRSTLRDLGPLRGMPLEALVLENTRISDLGPLRDLPLRRLDVWDFEGTDLSPLAGMKLSWLNCGCSKVRDISPLRGMPLNTLCLNFSLVSDLTPLAGMPLIDLSLRGAKVADLTPLRGLPLGKLSIEGNNLASREPLRQLPLTNLSLDYDSARDLELVTSIETLVTVNEKPIEAIIVPMRNR